MARRRLEGLERVLGVNALFSTAYGNVGSSIYYALGLVASYALGLTPILFLITGGLFLRTDPTYAWRPAVLARPLILSVTAGGIFPRTAATHAEAPALPPEAGRSSSFARHAFTEFWSFF